MKRKNTARNALVTSIISLLLCVSMLVGATFAWFTDEVVSGNNTIAAGNLDIEMYHSNGKVTDEKIAAATDLFLDKDGSEILWEPGVVSYENIKIANVGNLALQYRLSLNISDENNLKGHSLSEVLKVVLLEQPIASGATRAEVMALATAALEDPNYTLDGKLAQMVKQGELYPEGSTEGNDSITGALVIFWEPNDNEIDNLYNANNGLVTSDGEPLHIDFGVNLQATQLMYEEDSFGPDYDKLTGFRPMPSVDGYGPEISYTEGIGGAVKTTVLDTAYQFRPTETYEQGQKSEYFNYFVDFVVSADRYVPADSIMLAGYYDAWCGTLNDNNWVGLIGGDVDAGEEIRLVNTMGGGAMDFQYKLLLQYGNDGIGFLCGAKDMTGANAGTTLTVKLNMYKAVLNDEGHYEETGDVITVGEFTYTFPAKEAANQAELEAALATDGVIKLAAGNYELPDGSDVNLQGKNLAIVGTKDTVIDVSHVDARDQFVTGATVEFNGVTLNFGTANYMGFANTESLTFKNCKINGLQFLFGKNVTFENCELNSNGAEHCVWTYGAQNVTFKDCTFTYGDRGINCYSDNDVTGGKQTVNFKNCTFETSNTASAGAVEINSCFFSVGIEVNMDGCTAPAYGELAYVSPWDSTNGAKTTINIQ